MEKYKMIVCHFIWCMLVPAILIGQGISNLKNDTLHIPYNSIVKNGILKAISKHDKKYGYIDTLGRTVIPFNYDYASDFENGLAVVERDSKFGIIDSQNKTILPIDYSYIKNVKNGKCIAKKDGFVGVVDLKNKVLIPFEYDRLISEKNINFFFKLNETTGIRNYKQTYQINIPVKSVQVIEDKVFIIESNGKYHLIDAKANYLLTDYQKLKFKEEFILAKKNDKYGFVSKSGVVIEKCIYDDASQFSEGLIAMKLDDSWRYFDASGKLAFSVFYEKADPFYNGKAIIKKENKYGVINIKGSFIVQPEYDLIVYDKEEKLFLLSQQGAINILDENLNAFSEYVFSGNPADIKFRFHHYKFSDDLMAVKVDSLYGYLNREGDFSIAPKFRFARRFENGYAIVGLYNYGLINKSGKIILNEEYDDIKSEYGNYIVAQKDSISKVLKRDSILVNHIDGFVKEISKRHLLIQRNDSKMQLLNLAGESILPETYDQIEFQMFAPGISIKNGNAWGYYDLEAQKLVVPLKYEQVNAYYGGHTVIVKSEGYYGLLNKEGEVILKPEYDEIKAMTDGVLIIQDGKYGLFDKRGNEIFPLIYDSIDYLGNLKFKVVQNGESQIIRYTEKKDDNGR